MLHTILIAVLVTLLILIVVLTFQLRKIYKKNASDGNDAMAEKIELSQGWVYTALVGTSISLVVVVYFLLRGTIWEGHVMEWLNIVVRLMHITFGIAWIGASFYFVFLENALNRTENVRDELAGNLWAVHGGGFYYLEKYKVAPKQLPKHLHWFKYEAYFTWLSGFCLLMIVYYFNAKAMLVDKNILDISSLTAIGISIGSFITAWIIYDLMCKSPLIKNKLWFGIIGFAVLSAFAFGYTKVFAPRAAFIHFGALIGTLMAANVFFVIIPAQKAMVAAAKAGKPVNPIPGKNALARSLHNNYFTLPVLFVMVSNHFPSTFGYKYPWLILLIISVGTAGVKHWMNMRESGRYSVWVLPASVLVLLAACFISAPAKPGECKGDVTIDQVYNIVQLRCVSCHSSKPTDDVYTAAPNGVMFNTPDDIIKHKDQIMQRVVVTLSMPQNNKTNMTPEERDLIRCWIESSGKGNSK